MAVTLPVFMAFTTSSMLIAGLKEENRKREKNIGIIRFILF
jgi:hypothetical protein